MSALCQVIFPMDVHDLCSFPKAILAFCRLQQGKVHIYSVHGHIGI